MRRLREKLLPEYAPEVPQRDRVMGALCEDAALVFSGLILLALGSLL